MDARAAVDEKGTLSSLRSLGATLAELVGTRGELALIELREESQRRQVMTLMAAVAAIFLALGLLLAALFVVVVMWDTHRVAAAGGVTLLYLGIGVAVALVLRSRVRASPPPFESTRAEFAKDLESLRGMR